MNRLTARAKISEQTFLPFADGFIGHNLELEREFRRLGIEGEDAFYVLAARYAEFVEGARIEFSERFARVGKPLLGKVRADRHANRLLGFIADSDPRGANLPMWYEHFLGRRFREGSGKFFTPRPVASAVAGLLPKKNGAVVMDPTCGGGTLLIEASRAFGDLECTLVANDVEPSLVDLAQLTLNLGTPPSHRKRFLHANIFQPGAAFDEWRGLVDFIVANPPFSMKVNALGIESGLFSLGYRNSDALFLDVSLKLLRPGGRLVCLLPHSVVANVEFSRMRLAVEEKWSLLGVIGLPEGVFHLAANTTTRADIVVLEKKGSEASGADAVFASTPSVGVPLNGRGERSRENHLEELMANEEVRKALRLGGGA